jgi:uncharacterized protein
MDQVWQESGPVVISADDISGGQDLAVHDCEDCACAVSERPALRSPVPLSELADASSRWVSGEQVFDAALAAGYRLLFNSLGPGGVVVVNDPAHRLFRSFHRPARFSDASDTSPETAGRALAAMRRLGELGVIHPEGAAQRPAFPAGQVLTAWLHVTNACNLRCPYCYVNKSAEPMDENTGRAAVEAVMKSASSHGFTAVKLKYAGGEASLNHRLMTRLHGYAAELAAEYGLSLQATMLSNGVALGPDLIGWLRSAGVRVMISLDGIGEFHDAQRPTLNGRGSFRLVERGISRLIEHGHAPHLSITVTNRNAAGLADAVRFALERDLTFSLNLFRDNDCATPFPDLQYEEQSITSALLAAFGVIEEFLPRWSVLGSILDRGQLLEQRQRPCGVGEDYVVIDQHGRVAKCHMLIEQTLGDVLTSDPLELVRRDSRVLLNLAVDEKEGCRSCTWRYWCTGGCPAATFRATGRYDIKSPNCNIYRAIYPAALRLEGLRLLKYGAAPPGTSPEFRA